jgi:molybdenum cofactor cytidylyltransferase
VIAKLGEMTETSADFVSIIVLAAGLSTRFGRNKLLEPIGHDTMIERVVSESIRSKAKQVIAVCGHDFEIIQQKLRGYHCEIVLNEDYLKGQTFSIKKGLSRIKQEADAVVILPGDIALVDHRMINAVIDEYSMGNAPIVAAGYNGHSGHPILFDKNLLVELKDISEETHGLRNVVSRHKSEMKLVETSETSLLDVDTQEDMSKLTRVSSGSPDR